VIYEYFFYPLYESFWRFGTFFQKGSKQGAGRQPCEGGSPARNPAKSTKKEATLADCFFL